MRRLTTRWRIGMLCGLLAAGVAAIPLVEFTSSSSATSPDLIVFSQKKSSSYLQYEPGGATSGTGVVQQGVSASGACSQPSIASGGTALLNFNAVFYSSMTYSVATGNDAPAPIVTKAGTPPTFNAYPGMGNLKMGVGCDGNNGSTFAIEPGEDLIIQLGSNSVTSGRIFSEASIPLLNTDNKNPTTAQLVWSLHGKVVDSHQFVLAPGAEPIPPPDTGVVSSGFDQLDVEVINTSSTAAATVVGPTSTSPDIPTFTLAPQVCGGTTINTSGSGISASITNTAATGTDCKTYTNFSAGSGTPPANSGIPSGTHWVDFSSPDSSTSVHLTSHINWGDIGTCSPGPTDTQESSAASDDTGQCGYTYVSNTLNGTTSTNPEVFCETPGPPNNWCTTNAQYQIDPANGQTQLIEDMVGNTDWGVYR